VAHVRDREVELARQRVADQDRDGDAPSRKHEKRIGVDVFVRDVRE